MGIRHARRGTEKELRIRDGAKGSFVLNRPAVTRARFGGRSLRTARQWHHARLLHGQSLRWAPFFFAPSIPREVVGLWGVQWREYLVRQELLVPQLLPEGQN